MHMFPSIACLVVLGVGLLPQTIDGVPFTNLTVYFNVQAIKNVSAFYKEVLQRKEKDLAGRSGVVELPPGFFDTECILDEGLCHPEHSRTDLCFIVQTSCSDYKNDLKNVVKDIDSILGEVGDQSSYTIITYSKDPKQLKDWASVSKPPPKKIKPGKKCDDCQARLPLALDLCKKQFEDNHNDDPTRNVVPDVIVSYTDGLSFKSKFDKTYEETVRNKIIACQKYENTAGRAFKLKDTSYPSDEWPLLTFTNIGVPSFDIHIKNLKVNPFAVDIPAVEGLNKEGDPFTCPHCCNADVVVVIDRSNSIEVPDLTNVLEFFREFIAAQEYILDPYLLSLDPLKPGLRFAFITYACEVYEHCHLGAEDQTGLIKCVDDIPRTTEKFTNTVDALKKAGEQFDLYGRKLPDVREIVILATDGRTWNCNAGDVADPAATVAEAQKLKDDGKEIYVFGLPNHRGKTDGCTREWEPIASEPKACHVIDFITYGSFARHDLSAAGLHLTKEICTQGREHDCTYDFVCHN